MCNIKEMIYFHYFLSLVHLSHMSKQQDLKFFTAPARLVSNLLEALLKWKSVLTKFGMTVNSTMSPLVLLLQ